MSRALLMIDLQNDYFPDGSFPLWNTEEALSNALAAIGRAKDLGIPVVHVQHVADGPAGTSPFFNDGTEGVRIHPSVLQAAPQAPVVRKHHADGFEQTGLDSILRRWGTTELLIGGMMTQNCVTHTALSRAADPYAVTVLTDCCTTTDAMIHAIALHALSTRVALEPWAAVLA